ncbi:hypothetical protein QQ054_33660 [Oscillatoria amoena NRMC-F 0135]|nr:hypothetical protein [Oscillatoria amoena NRMC-F 0135]
MPVVRYQEVQRFSNLRWLWIFMIGLVIAELVLLVPALQANSQSSIIITLTLLAGLLPILLILFVFRYDLKVDHEGLHYRFFPRSIRWKKIPLTMIASANLKNKETFYEKVHLGYSHNPFTRTEIVNITGNKYLELILKDGVVVKLGSENPEEILVVLNKLNIPADE